MAKTQGKLGEILIAAGLLNKEDLDQALSSQKGKTLSRTLIDLKLVTEEKLAQAVAQALHLPFVDLSAYSINPGAATLVSEELARKYQTLPIDFENSTLVVATSDPTNVLALDDLRILTGYSLKPVVVTESSLEGAISGYSKMDKMVEEVVESVTEEAATVREDLENEEEVAEEAPIVKLVDLILSEGAQARAGDIHIEPQEKDLKVRYRIDGVLQERMRSPKRIQAGVISRVKILAGMDIAERRLPQDGRFGFKIDGRSIDFRVATLPTIHGEKVVLRLLEKESALFKLEDLGFLPEGLKRFKLNFTKPYGALFITGPTGCGKTTTLYATLNILNTLEKNIITVEDPVEYRLSGINQVQVNPKAGLTFSTGLRSILRNDPDIVMIGEIRDEETALIAIESALTGHLVLSTLHTGDAPSALTRLTEMGIEPFLTASAADCVVAQRLARRLCEHCKQPYHPSSEVLKEMGLDSKKGKFFLFQAKGCSRCQDTGYKGRIGLFEVLLLSEEIEKLVVKKASSEELKKVAVSQGMKTLMEDGLEKVKQGVTSLEEIMRVIA